MEDRLRRMQRRTLRWNDARSTEGYCAVEFGKDDLAWFAWSHRHGVGMTPIATQTWAEFAAKGPPVEVPAPVLDALRRAATEQRG